MESKKGEKPKKGEKVKKGEKAKKFAKNTGKKTNDKKAQINNQIIQFQGKFKQAKVGTIRKLVQKLKHPEKKPKQNLVAKAERYENVLNQLKHTSPKRLGVLALIYYKSGKNYLADQNSTVEQLAVGYFTEFKGLSDVLETIRNKLNLIESTDWKKSAKKLFRKKDKAEKPEKTKKSEKKKKGSFTETDDTDTNTKLRNKKQKQNSVNDKTEKVAQKRNEESEDNSDSDSSNESEEEIEAPTTVDDFFITADGSNYLSTAVVNKEQENDSGDDSNTRKVFEKKPKEASFFHKSDKRPVKLGTNRFEDAKRKRLNETVEPIRTVKEMKIDPELHPSWQAKQKLKPTITEFKGTKITFD